MNQLMRYGTMIILIGILAFIFFFQQEYFSDEFNSPVWGSGLLLIYLVFEFYSHTGFWRAKVNNEKTVQYIFLFFSVMLIAISTFANLATMINLSEEARLDKLYKRKKIQQSNQGVEQKKRLIQKEIERIEKLLESKDRSIKRTSKWTVGKIEDQKDLWSLKLVELSTELIKLSSISHKNSEEYGILENFQTVTGINSNVISLITKGFFSILLACIPFFISYFIIEKGKMNTKDSRHKERYPRAKRSQKLRITEVSQGEPLPLDDYDFEGLDDDETEEEETESQKEVLPAKRQVNSLVKGIGKINGIGILI